MISLRFALLLFRFAFDSTSASEKDVLDHIFQGYDPRIRPIKNTSSTIIVQAQPMIIRLIEVAWTDEFLVWDPADFNGTEMVTVTSNAMWLPDTMIATTTFENEDLIDKERQMVALHHDGLAVFSIPFVLSNYCPMKTDEFPYDQQNCIIKITSWLYQKHLIMFELFPHDIPAVQNDNSEWDVMGITGKTFDLTLPGLEFRQLHFTLTIKRKPAYYIWVLIMPTFIITALSIAGIFAPVNNHGDRQEKITLGLTTLLTLAVILSMVTGEMPRSARLPLLGQFVLAEICIIVICMAISLLALFLHQRSTTRSWRVPFRQAKNAVHHGNKVKNESEKFTKATHLPSAQVLYGKENAIKFHDVSDELKTAATFEVLDDSVKQLGDAVARVSSYIEKKESKIVAEEEEEQRKHEWLILFDRLDLLLFIGFQVAHAALYVALYAR